MPQRDRSILIIGGGIAGLCTGVYAQKSGYQAQILEMHDSVGGLATSWHRGDYTFETCLHWLLGSNPMSETYAHWRELFDIDRLTFVNHDEFVRIEHAGARPLHIYTDHHRLRDELLSYSPADRDEIEDFISSIKVLSTTVIPDPTKNPLANWGKWFKFAPHLHLIHHLAKTTCTEYGNRFRDPMLRAFFRGAESDRLSSLAILFSLAWMNNRDAGYPIGGSQAVIRHIADSFTNLGGRVRCNSRVARVIVEDDTAVGVELTDGTILRADWIVSAADAHTTVYSLLHGRYRNHETDKIFSAHETFSSYAQVSLGIARDFHSEPGFLTRLLGDVIEIDPGTFLDRLSFRIFNYDPTFAPAGKTAVTCFLPTRNFAYWVNLHDTDPERYASEKQRLAGLVIHALEQRFPGIHSEIEVTNVSTPATVIRLTGNWKGSYEGWLITPDTPFRQLPNSLPGLENFRMAGQWIMPGGGLPSGLMTARSTVHSICEQDSVPFASAHAVAAD